LEGLQVTEKYSTAARQLWRRLAIHHGHPIMGPFWEGRIAKCILKEGKGTISSRSHPSNHKILNLKNTISLKIFFPK
jgi:hypothetical protein